jgi:tRNA nucleotidyltransferase (CCA-adding enzyme)
LHSLSFVEDPTRVFRAVRFAVRFDFALSRETRVLIRGIAKMDLLRRLSKHRLTDELRLVLSERDPLKAIALMDELKVLACLHPDLALTPRLRTLLKATEEALDWYRLLYLDRPMENWLVYLMAVLQVLPDQAVGEVLKRIELSARQEAAVRAGRFGGHRIYRELGRRPSVSPAAVYRALSGTADETLVFLMGRSKSEHVRRQISAYVTTYQRMRPALTGDDLKQMGIKPGPLYRRILSKLLEARLNGVVNSEDEERALVRSLIGRRRSTADRSDPLPMC